MACRDRQERSAQGVPPREAEGRVRGAACHVHPERVSDHARGLHEERHRPRLGADRHRQRVDHDVLRRYPVIGCSGDDLPRRLQPPLRVHRYLVVVRETDDGCSVSRDDRQDRVQPLVLGGDGVDERLPLVHLEPRLERLDHGRVDRERRLGQRLDERDGLRHQADLVGEWISDVHVEDVGSRLLGDVGLDLRQVAVLQLCLERLPACWIDALADDAKRPLRTDDDRPRP
jgi:hypothetical protein